MRRMRRILGPERSLAGVKGEGICLFLDAVTLPHGVKGLSKMDCVSIVEKQGHGATTSSER